MRIDIPFLVVTTAMLALFSFQAFLNEWRLRNEIVVSKLAVATNAIEDGSREYHKKVFSGDTDDYRKMVGHHSSVVSNVDVDSVFSLIVDESNNILFTSVGVTQDRFLLGEGEGYPSVFDEFPDAPKGLYRLFAQGGSEYLEIKEHGRLCFFTTRDIEQRRFILGSCYDMGKTEEMALSSVSSVIKIGLSILVIGVVATSIIRRRK